MADQWLRAHYTGCPPACGMHWSSKAAQKKKIRAWLAALVPGARCQVGGDPVCLWVLDRYLPIGRAGDGWGGTWTV